MLGRYYCGGGDRYFSKSGPAYNFPAQDKAAVSKTLKELEELKK
jgi:hypothetical protein